MTGSIKGAVKAALKVKSRIRITERIAPAKGESHTARAFVSLIAEGDIYESVREQFEADEVILQEMIGVRSLTVDEAIKVILMQLGGEKRSFSYASFVRAKRDLLKEISPEIVEERDHFQIEGSFGMSMFFIGKTMWHKAKAQNSYIYYTTENACLQTCVLYTYGHLQKGLWKASSKEQGTHSSHRLSFA